MHGIHQGADAGSPGRALFPDLDPHIRTRRAEAGIVVDLVDSFGQAAGRALSAQGRVAVSHQDVKDFGTVPMCFAGDIHHGLIEIEVAAGALAGFAATGHQEAPNRRLQAHAPAPERPDCSADRAASSFELYSLISQPSHALAGQQRAVDVLVLGTCIGKPGMNLFVIGLNGMRAECVGRASSSRGCRRATKSSDWV